MFFYLNNIPLHVFLEYGVTVTSFTAQNCPIHTYTAGISLVVSAHILRVPIWYSTPADGYGFKPLWTSVCSKAQKNQMIKREKF